METVGQKLSLYRENYLRRRIGVFIEYESLPVRLREIEDHVFAADPSYTRADIQEAINALARVGFITPINQKFERKRREHGYLVDEECYVLSNRLPHPAALRRYLKTHQ